RELSASLPLPRVFSGFRPIFAREICLGSRSILHNDSYFRRKSAGQKALPSAVLPTLLVGLGNPHISPVASLAARPTATTFPLPQGKRADLLLTEIGQPKMRRTEVRPIFSRRAISDLLTPARCSFRISAAWTAAVAGRPSRFPFALACARPARVRSRRISR